MVQAITSRDNATIKYACKIAQSKAFRQSEGRFLAEGLRLCDELCRTLVPLKVFYTSMMRINHPEVETWGGEQFEMMTHVAEKLAETRTPQGVFAMFSLPVLTLSDVRKNGCYVVLEAVQDPANAGAVLRSAAAFGFDGVVLCGPCADVFAGKALRASMGAVGRIAVIVAESACTAVDALREKGIPVYAAALEGAQSIVEIIPNANSGVALLIGNEGNGLTAEALAAADHALRIPMTDGAESLNAAVAAGVLLWHFRAGDAR